MSKSDEYRRNAAECQRMAESTRNEGDRRSWLRLAESWMRLIGGDSKKARSSQEAAENFETQRRARGTGQRDSESKH
jgi:hypothetical protein